MDNQVHHPHVTYSSEVGGAYSKDYYNDKARLWIFILLCTVIVSKAFYEYGQANDPVSTKANVTVTVTRHSDPFSGPDFNKRYEVDPKIKAAVDSMWAAEKESVIP